jgi:hypothetical protein
VVVDHWTVVGQVAAHDQGRPPRAVSRVRRFALPVMALQR